jgi:hypothetical protein
MCLMLMCQGQLKMTSVAQGLGETDRNQKIFDTEIIKSSLF